MIESIRLERFKNFRDATLTLGPLTVVVGTNASGKSNLRDAFRFIHGIARGYSLAEVIGEKYVEGERLQWKGIRGGTRETAMYGATSFAIETTIAPQITGNRTELFNSGAGQQKHRIEVSLGDSRSSPRVIRESFQVAGGMNYDSHPDGEIPAQEGPEYLFVRTPRDDVNRKIGKRLRFLSAQPVISQFAGSKDVPRAISRTGRRVLGGTTINAISRSFPCCNADAIHSRTNCSGRPR